MVAAAPAPDTSPRCPGSSRREATGLKPDMDPVTHTLSGVVLANAVFRKRIGPGAVPILAVAANLPDIDALVHITGDPAAVVLRRSFGHSILLLPLLCLLFALLMHRFYPHLERRSLFGLGLAGAAMHIVLDLINSFGVVLLWPLSDWRPELAIVFIIDFILTGFLVLPLIARAVPRLRSRVTSISRFALAAVAVYLVLCGTGRHLALGALRTETAASGEKPDFVYVFPEALGPHRWRGVVRSGDGYVVYLIRLMSGRVDAVARFTTRTDDARVQRVLETRLGSRLQGFFKAPVWQVVEGSAGGGNGGRRAAEVTGLDLRFLSVVLHRDPVFVFRFRVEPDGRVEPVKEVSRKDLP